MKRLLLSLSLTPLLFGGCLHNREPETQADVTATPTGPCRDDESLESGRCVPRVPGSGLTPR